MYVTLIIDRCLFESKAVSTENVIKVTVSPTTVLENEFWKPAKQATYELEFEDPNFGPSKWLFREIYRFEHGRIDTTKSLFNKLRENSDVKLSCSAPEMRSWAVA